jgi:hypothetical protein
MGYKAIRKYKNWLIPTLDEIRDVTRPMYESTISQITRGQAIYYGYEVDHEVDNEIPGGLIGAHDKIVKSQAIQVEKRTVIRAKKRLIQLISRFNQISEEEAYQLLKERKLI